jgi:hypothetical protein
MGGTLRFGGIETIEAGTLVGTNTRTTPALDRFDADDLSDCANAGTARTVLASDHVMASDPDRVMQDETILRVLRFAVTRQTSDARPRNDHRVQAELDVFGHDAMMSRT